MPLSSPRTILITRACAPLILCAALCACDPLYGIDRGALLSGEPDVTCVQRTLEQTPGITQVKALPRTEGKIIAVTQILTFSGAPGSNIHGMVDIHQYKGQWSLSNTNRQIGQPVPQADMDATRPVMQQIETRLADQCGLTELKTNVKEKQWHGFEFWLD